MTDQLARQLLAQLKGIGEALSALGKVLKEVVDLLEKILKEQERIRKALQK